VRPSSAQVNDAQAAAAHQGWWQLSFPAGGSVHPERSDSQSQGAQPAPEKDKTDDDSPRPERGSSKYVPLSTQGKFNIFFRSTYDVSTFFSAAFEGTLAQAEGQWPGYGGGFPGWGKRIGASLADTEARNFIQSFALCSLLHQDPR